MIIKKIKVKNKDFTVPKINILKKKINIEKKKLYQSLKKAQILKKKFFTSNLKKINFFFKIIIQKLIHYKFKFI